MVRHAFGRLAALLVALVIAAPCMAQNWPDRPLKFIVSAPAGSSLDVLARTIADKLKDRIGQPVVVDDRPAAGGTAATDFVAKSSPDGYTMVMGNLGTHAASMGLYKNLSYDPRTDFEPVMLIATTPMILLVNKKLPVVGFQDASAFGADASRGDGRKARCLECCRVKLRVDVLDSSVTASLQIGAYNEIAELVRRLGLWFLANVPSGADLGETIAIYRSGVQTLRGTFSNLVSAYEAAATEKRISDLREAGLPLDLAEDISVLPLLGSTPEIVLLAQARGFPVDYVAGAYFTIGAALGLDRLRGRASQIAGHEHWDRLAVRRIMDDLYAGQRALATKALTELDRSTARLTPTL